MSDYKYYIGVNDAVVFEETGILQVASDKVDRDKGK